MKLLWVGWQLKGNSVSACCCAGEWQACATCHATDESGSYCIRPGMDMGWNLNNVLAEGQKFAIVLGIVAIASSESCNREPA